MVRCVYECDLPMSKDELLNYWIHADRTILATKNENSNGLPDFWHKFDAGGLFYDRGTGFRFTIGGEVEFLRHLEQQLGDSN